MGQRNKGYMGMELYYFYPSPPCRAVLLFIHALSLEPQLIEIDISKEENLSPEYVKLNPQHTIPLIVDDGFVLSESRAILIYLAEQYGENSSYYPNDPKARGVINQRLMFDLGTLFPRFWATYSHLFVPNATDSIDETKLDKLKEAFDFLEAFMGDSSWMAGDEITLADYSMIATVSTIEACKFDLTPYQKVKAWLERCKTEMIDYDEVNQKGADVFRSLIDQNLIN